MFNLFCSMLPPTALKVVSWFGFPGNRNRGLELLHRAHEANTFVSPLAALILLSFYVVVSLFVGEQTEEDLRKADALLAWANEHYPRAALFSHSASRLSRVRGQLRKAIEQCDTALADLPSDLPANFTLMFYYQKGWCSFLLTEWRDAARFFQPVLDLDDPKDIKQPPIKAFYAYQSACCLAMLGERDRVQALAERVPHLIYPHLRSRSIETYAVRKAGQFGTSFYDPVLDTFELIFFWDGFYQMPPEVVARCLAVLDECARLHKFEANHDDSTSNEDKIYAIEALLVIYGGQPGPANLNAVPTLEECKSSIADVTASTWDQAQLARYFLARAIIFKAQKRPYEALDMLNRAIEWGLAASHSSKVSKVLQADGVLPFTFYTQAQILMSLNRLHEAQESHKRATSYAAGDLVDVLSVRLHTLSQALDARMHGDASITRHAARG